MNKNTSFYSHSRATIVHPQVSFCMFFTSNKHHKRHSGSLLLQPSFRKPCAPLVAFFQSQPDPKSRLSRGPSNTVDASFARDRGSPDMNDNTSFFSILLLTRSHPDLSFCWFFTSNKHHKRHTGSLLLQPSFRKPCAPQVALFESQPGPKKT